MQPSLPHTDWATTIASSATFHPEQIAFDIPLPGTTTRIHAYTNAASDMLILDVWSDGAFAYCGVHAADMPRPRCPVFKHGCEGRESRGCPTSTG
jgi:hypothetical protein